MTTIAGKCMLQDATPNTEFLKIIIEALVVHVERPVRCVRVCLSVCVDDNK